MKQKIGLMEVKQALRDGRFRDALPLEMRDDLAKYLQNPGCSCNVPLYKKIFKNCTKQLLDYFPNRDLAEENEVVKNPVENHWQVINCGINDLETRLRKLGPGRKQIAICRWEDQVTVVVNELDFTS